MSGHRFTLRLPGELFAAVSDAAAAHRRPIAEEMRVLLAAQLQPDKITRRQLMALHARAGQLDREIDTRPGRSKAEVLLAVGEHFGLGEVTSAGDLTVEQASWALDWLRCRLEA